MTELIDKVSRFLGVDLDPARYLHIATSSGKHTEFFYRMGQSLPCIVGRVPFNSKGLTSCDTELAAQIHLRAKAVSGITVPESLGVLQHHGTSHYLQEAIVSRPMMDDMSLIRRRLPESLFRNVTRTLIGLYRQTRESSFIEGKGYARCFEHGDFWVLNLGYVGERLVLYDLEFSDVRGLPLHDLLHFGLHYAVVMRNLGKENHRVTSPTSESVQEAFIESPLADLMRECIETYLRGCEITGEEARELMKEYIEGDQEVSGLAVRWEHRALP
jgi:hypothetical protein